MNEPKIDLCTIVWGWMASFYRWVTLPSLLQEANIPAIALSIGSYDFYATREARKSIESISHYTHLTSLVPVAWHSIDSLETNKYVLEQMKACVNNGNYLLLVTPEAVWGNESLRNIVDLMRRDYNPILYPMAKVLFRGFLKIIQRLEAGIISNRELVSIIMPHLHLWRRRFNVGYTIERANDSSWELTSYVPTPTLKLDEKLLNFFSSNSTPFSGFDHVLPYYMVKSGYPYHLITHSDICFLAEYYSSLGGTGSRAWQSELAEESEKFFSQFKIIWQGVSDAILK